MKLSLGRSSSKEIPWLDRKVLGTLRRIIASLGSSDDTVEVVLVDGEFIRKLNRDYRGVDRVTDVISFSYMDGDPHYEGNVAGELYVSCETVEKEAKEQAVDPKHLFLRVTLHGLLHILSCDHRTEENARAMEQQERRILGMHLSSEELESLF